MSCAGAALLCLAAPSRCVPSPRSGALLQGPGPVPGWVGSCSSLPSDRNCSSTGTKGLVGGVRESSGEQQPPMCCLGCAGEMQPLGWGRDPPLSHQGRALWGLVPEGSGLVCPVLLL